MVPETAVPVLFLLGLAGTATLTIWSRDPFVEWGYEVGILLLAGWTALRMDLRRFAPVAALSGLAALWGFAQWVAGATADRYATLNAALRVLALAATAFAASEVFARPALRDRFLRWFAGFGFLVAILSLLAYYASPGKILWLIASPYPDVWGPFLSRNNFAQFLELAFPVALWHACRRRGAPYYMWMSAAMLACGLASASRAGAALLLVETVAVLALTKTRTSPWKIAGFALATLAFAILAGAGFLIERFTDSDPLRVRREIYQATGAMIAARPWTGYGLGTFASVYPEFARFDPGATVEHAHSDWLEWSAEGGFSYALLWLLLAVAAARPARRSVWGIGVPAVFLHALADDPFARLGVSAWVFVLAGALGTRRQE